ncbi:MAG: M1 family metallopeptidase [Anaerolineae bacterium]|nr:M1 family metallopeptidase [Anaerolineae bacterium]
MAPQRHLRRRLLSYVHRVVTLCGLIGVIAFSVPPLSAQAPSPPPDVASYTISATYDPDTHRITAQETATYVNHTDAAIPDLVFHLYLNAFSSADTLWMREAGPQHRGFSFSADHPGWIQVGEIRLAEGTALTLEPVDADSTLVQAALPTPVLPGESVTVELAFEAQLPRVFARTGWADGGDFVMAGQWFPKFGVWEEGAWNAYPFHANSEFYADFGAYRVDVTLPHGWIVDATGVRDGDVPAPNDDGTVTHRFRADHVIDFAWSASPHFRRLSEAAGDVAVTVTYPSGQRAAARRVLSATLEALALYEDWYGSYGRGLYPALTVIVVPPDAGGAGGMEYPTLFTVGATATTATPRCVRLLEVETVHELGHQWFQSLVATNEAEEPWLDEGFTDYTTARAMARLEGGEAITCGGWTLSYLGLQRLTYAMLPEITMAGKAWDFGAEYGVATYAKPVVALSTLERTVGEAAMLRFLRTYVDTYAFKHATGEDVRAVMADTLGEETATWFFDELVYDDVTLDVQVAETGADGAVLVREGDLCLPVPVEVAMQSGEIIQPWPCGGPFEADAEGWQRVTADPDRTVLVDLNLANNAARRRLDWQSWLGSLARLTRTLQSFFRCGWLP